MAKKKKIKWKYKYVSIDAYHELEQLSKEELTKKILQFDTNTKAEQKNKKQNTELTELRKQISAHRKSYENRSHSFEEAKEAFESEKSKRDYDITEAIEDKNALESGYNSAIANFKEHRDVCLSLLKNRS